jgi:hypothetical protein
MKNILNKYFYKKMINRFLGLMITSSLVIGIFSSVFAQQASTETTVQLKITQTFITESERKANRVKFEGMANQTGLNVNKREGVWVKLVESESDLKELLTQSRNFKDVLTKGVKSIGQMRLNERLSKYVDLMRGVVTESDNVTSELLMRYSLNRGMAVQELFSQERVNVKTEMSIEALKSLELRILKDAVNRAVVLYDKDEKFLDILNTAKAEQEKNQEMKKKFGFDLFEVSKLEYERDYANYIVELTTNAPNHNGTFQLLKYTVIQLFNGVNASLLRNQSTKLKSILRNLYELGIELPDIAPNDPLIALSLNNMLKDNLELIIKDYNLALDMFKSELSKYDSQIKAEFEKQRAEQQRLKMAEDAKKAEAQRIEDARIAEEKRLEELAKKKIADQEELVRVNIEKQNFYNEYLQSRWYKKIFRLVKKSNDETRRSDSAGFDYEGRVYTAPSGRTVVFKLNFSEKDPEKRVTLGYFHESSRNFSTSYEIVDNVMLVQMDNRQRWTIKEDKDPTCLLISWSGAAAEKICDGSVPVPEGTDMRGIYVSTKTSRFIKLSGHRENPSITFYQGRTYGPFEKPYIITSSSIHYDLRDPHNITLQFKNKDCFTFTFSYSESDELCRYSENANIKPYGFYKSPERTIIFRTKNNQLTIEHNHNGQAQYPVILENGVGYSDTIGWGFKVEDKNCITIYYGNTANGSAKNDKVCKEE